MAELILREHLVKEVRLGDATKLRDGVLALDEREVLAVAAPELPVCELGMTVARPGTKVRINRVLDVVEPRAKVRGPGATFPGIAIEDEQCGSGETAVAAGLAIVATGTITNLGGAFEQEDCVIDMSGPGAPHTPFSRTVNLVLSFTLENGASQEASARATREATIRVARWIGHVVGSGSNPRTTSITDGDGQRTAGSAARIAYVCQLISEGCIHDTLLRGVTTEALPPTCLRPSELMDGALVSADFHYACQRVPTYLYQRNPVVSALMQRRDELDFAGVILTIRRESEGEKRVAAKAIARLAEAHGITGLITHPAVGGNAQLDALFVVQEAERSGIRTAMIVQEMAGAEGADPGLVDFVPEADLLVSTGNREELVATDRADDVIGGMLFLDGRDASEATPLPLRFLCASTSQVGALPQRGAAA